MTSDGYVLTVLQLDSRQGLLETVRGLIAQSQDKLGLETGPEGLLLSPMPSVSPKHKSPPADVHDFVASITRGSEMAKVLSSSIKSSGGHSLLFSQADMGRIHFATEESMGSSGLDLEKDGESFSEAIALFQAALGMLISCELFAPCVGMLPSTRSLELEDIALYKSKLSGLVKALVITASKLVSETSLTAGVGGGGGGFPNDAQHRRDTMSHEFIISVFKLISLDKLKQSHMELSTSLANAILVAFLSGLVERHCDFTKVLHTNQCSVDLVKEYTNKVVLDLQDASHLVEEMVSVLESTYGTRPSVFGVVLKTKQPSLTSHILSLTPSLKVLLNLSSALWKDMKLCKKITRSLKHSNTIATGDFSLLKNSFAYTQCILKSLQGHIQHLLSPSWSHLPAGARYHSAKHSNLVTYTPPASDYKEFLSKLKDYNLRACMETVLGHIEECDGDPECPVSQDPNQLSDILDASIVSRPDLNIPPLQVCVRSDSVQHMAATLGELMAAFFANRRLFVPLSSDPSAPRYTELSRQKLTLALQDQDLLGDWTVERTVSLLLLSGKWRKACDFVTELGDWRKAFVLACMVTLHWEKVLNKCSSCSNDSEHFSSLLHKLALDNILRLIGSDPARVSTKSELARLRQATLQGHGLFEPNRRACEQFVSETLRICALSQVDSVLVSVCSHFLKELVSHCSGMATKVHSSVYLPAPPLYCFQPSVPKEVIIIVTCCVLQSTC